MTSMKIRFVVNGKAASGRQGSLGLRAFAAAAAIMVALAVALPVRAQQASCKALEAIAWNQSVLHEVIDAAEQEGIIKNDATCLATVGMRRLSQQNCTAAQAPAERAAELAESDPEAHFVRGLAHACKLGKAAARIGKGLPVQCDRDALNDVMFDVGFALQSRMEGAQRSAIVALEQDVATNCRDDDGVILATVSAMATTSGLPSVSLDMLGHHPRTPMNITGAMDLLAFQKYVVSNEVGPAGLSVLRARARNWVILSVRGSLRSSPFLSLGPQVAASALLKADRALATDPTSGGLAFEDIDLMERTGALDKMPVMGHAVAAIEPWLSNARLAPSAFDDLAGLVERLGHHGTSPLGAKLLLETRMLVAIREEAADPCVKSTALHVAITDFAGTGAQTLPLGEWQTVVKNAAREGAIAAQECPNATGELHSFEDIENALEKSMTPWPPQILASAP